MLYKEAGRGRAREGRYIVQQYLGDPRRISISSPPLTQVECR
jgi:hypothetical protein